MNTRALARRLRAYGEGLALPNGETLHTPLAADGSILRLAFVRMGGESAPWGVGLGTSRSARQYFTIAEPRNRDLAAAMMANLAPILLGHLKESARIDAPAFRQVWLPNDSHVEMLHLLAYRYTFARRADPKILNQLNQLGRCSNHLFLESQRPGQSLVVSATAALRDAYTFPADDIRQQHLGFLLAWLSPKATPKARVDLAEKAEAQSISTSLDPAIERDQLAPHVEAWNEAAEGKPGDEARRKAEQAVKRVLTAELSRRLDLLEAAIDVLRREDRRPNHGLGSLTQKTIQRLHRELPAVERGRTNDGEQKTFVRSPDTDRHPQHAASAFFDLQAAHDETMSLLIHDDIEMQADAISEGDAIRGTVTEVQDVKVGKGHEITWIVESPSSGPLRLREGSEICVARDPKRTLKVLEIEDLPSGGRRFALEITGGKRATIGLDGSSAAAHDRSHEGTVYTFVPTYPSEIHRRRNVGLWAKDKPGAWVHSVGRPAVDAPEGDDEA